MAKPYTKSYDLPDEEADGIVDGGSGASLTLLSTSAGDGLAHRLNFTSAQNISDHTFTVVGTDADGAAQTEVVTGPNATTVESDKYFATWTSITPNATLASDEVDIGWVDEVMTPTYPVNWRASEVSVNVAVTGTINYTLRQTFDPLQQNSSAQNLNWTNCTDTDLVTATASQITSYDKPVTAVQIITASYGSGAEFRWDILQADK